VGEGQSLSSAGQLEDNRCGGQKDSGCGICSSHFKRLDAGLDSRDYGVHRLYCKVEYLSINSTDSLSQRHSDNFGNFLRRLAFA
jgi:hypothetical protein